MYQFISSSAEGNVVLRRRQYEYNSLDAAKQLIANKIHNQRTMIVQLRDKQDSQKKAVARLDNCLAELELADSVRSIMGIEGNASRVYFQAYFDNVAWLGRKPRVKRDMVNALMDIGYSILFGYIDSLLAIYGFDRYVGILHTQFYMRKSLVCDIVEPFRVLIDKQIKKGINLGQFKEKDFEIYDGKWCLKYQKSAEYSGIFLTVINEHKEEIFIYVRDFYRSFMKNELKENFPEWDV